MDESDLRGEQGPPAEPGSGLPPRPRPGDARPRRGVARAHPAPVRTGRVQALAGAALSVLGVALGIVVLQWVTEPPAPSTVITERSSGSAVLSPAAPVDPRPPAVTGSTGAAASPDAPGGAAAEDAETPAVPAPASPTPAAVAPPAPVVPVTVLNNSRRTGLAARAAERIQAAGWPVTLTGNFRGRLPVTTVYYDPGLEASARAFAQDVDGVVRVRPRFPTLPARGVVVVVTREFPA